jgi:hypothetical protein
MHCLYCNKRLWLLFSKKRLFCSKLHEVAYQDGLAVMRRLMELAVPVEPPANPPIPPIAAPALRNFVIERGGPKPIPPDPAAVLRLEAVPFAGRIEFPSSNRGLIAVTLDSATEPVGEIATIANERVASCRVQSKGRRRIPPQSPAAFSLRTHRRRLR